MNIVKNIGIFILGFSFSRNDTAGLFLAFIGLALIALWDAFRPAYWQLEEQEQGNTAK